jgi:hypothetical protein
MRPSPSRETEWEATATPSIVISVTCIDDFQPEEEGVATTYGADIQPLFRAKDIKCMSAHVSLNDPQYMCDPAGDGTFPDHANARLVYSRLTDPNSPMPPDGPWPPSQIATYQSWMTDGFQP